MNVMDQKRGTTELEPRHDFTSKLRQPALLPDLVRYIRWQREVRKARELGTPEPAYPSGSVPVSINLDLTTTCNYRCDHCIDHDALNTRHKYDPDELLQSLEYMIKRGLRSVILIGGGEPTLHPMFVEVVRFLKQRDVQVAIVSNGSRNEVIHEIAGELSGKDWVRLSLDAGTDSTFLKMHKPKKPITLDEICTWVPLIYLRNPRLSIGFSYIITWSGAQRDGTAPIVENRSEIVTATRLAQSYGFGYITFKAFLTRGEGGAEVMDPNVMADLQSELELIRHEIAKAKEFETPDFKVVESTNLRVLLDQTWESFTRQPRTCHMQAFRQVLSPLGLYNCPAHRGMEKARISAPNAYAADGRTAADAVAGILHRFDARKECSSVTCLYNPTNHWIEQAIEATLDPEKIEPLADRGDFFL